MPASRDPRPARPAPGPAAHSPGHGLLSALPDAAFRAQELSVEDALLASARHVFLRHMAGTKERLPSQPDATEPPTELAGDDDLAPDELRACVDEIAGLARLEPPDLMSGLQHERVWILMHMARHGVGLCRQRATQELRATLRQVTESPAAHRGLLAAMADRLADVDDGVGRTTIFRALLEEVRHALAQSSLATSAPR